MANMQIEEYPAAVELVQHTGSDDTVAAAARVSTGANGPGENVDKLIGYLMRNRHYSPFEHTSVTFRIETPIFVAREMMRHRVISFNEVSGRYGELPMKVYIPPRDRPLVNKGSGAHPDLTTEGNTSLDGQVIAKFLDAYEAAARAYRAMLDAGVATEVARDVLPVGLYTAFYATSNLRGWQSFLSLRDGQEGHPLWEITKVAEAVGRTLDHLFPHSMTSWRESRGT